MNCVRWERGGERMVWGGREEESDEGERMREEGERRRGDDVRRERGWCE